MRRFAASVLALVLLTASGVSAAADTPEQVIEEAMEVYAWMTMWPLDVDLEVPGGEGLFLVLDDRYQTRAALDEKLKEYFSQEIVDFLWSWEVYEEIDGRLYCGEDAGRPIDESISEVEYEFTEQTAEKNIYTATVYYLNDSEESLSEAFIFVKELVDDQWVFTDFPFFW